MKINCNTRNGVLFLTTIISFGSSCFAMNPSSNLNSISPKKEAEPNRRAKPAPFDSIFPSTEYLGPTIGVPNTDPIFPLTNLLWSNFPELKENDIRVYGWVNPSFNASTSKNSNVPLFRIILSLIN